VEYTVNYNAAYFVLNEIWVEKVTLNTSLLITRSADDNRMDECMKVV
jgi:hypothetical protein